MVRGPNIITVHETSLPSGESLKDLVDELNDYWAVLNGEEKAPFDHGWDSTLMEYGQEVYARAMFIQYSIQQMERTGIVEKNSPLYKFRTGELRTFIEVAKASAELGSRRLTKAKMEQEAKLDGMG